MAAVGLLPAAMSHGIGSESSRPLARVVIGGIICAMFFSIWIFPIFFAGSYRKFDPQHSEDQGNNDEKGIHQM
jgi:cobalt-zinc-cadmium resistance protein CzcA